ncbi:hypothetical protein [Paludisphaera rhizosphaerae]|uniref:hypothetical protein n=1 Tax=Paludisphaera rhizosphaerae TaxID=2711216 RepID=UPI001C6EC315|nr:hypothetical protein [Paludisphaera rhizosphaerae]
MNRPLLCVLLLPALVLAGCGAEADYPREPFSGTVTIDGKPLAKGHVVFEPKDQGVPTQSGGEVVDGKFDVPQEAGAMAGTYSVLVFADDAPLPVGVQPGTVEADAAIRKAAKTVVKVPRQFNINTTLSAEVKAGGPNAFSFDLTSKPAGK